LRLVTDGDDWQPEAGWQVIGLVDSPKESSTAADE